jgi:DNA-binding NarL/FixJ family response regulator
LQLLLSLFAEYQNGEVFFNLITRQKKAMISVAIVDDKRDIREGLQKLLNMAEGFRCVYTYDDAESAIQSIPRVRPDVVLMDVELPRMSGIECVKVLRQKIPDLDIIMLSSYSDDEHIFQALKAGAYGYLTKNIFPSKLLNAIREVRSGGSPMSSSVARRVVASFCNSRRSMPALSDREQEVLDLLCEGRSYQDIAQKLYVSANTIRFHLKNIYKKLQVNSRHEAVARVNRSND